MKTFGLIAKWLIIIVGVVFAIYTGIWIMFAGGIIQIIDALKNDLENIEIAKGVVRIILATPVGTLIISISGIVGVAIQVICGVDDKVKIKKRQRP